MNESWVNVFWFRRDLRLEDNHGLYEALKDDIPVVPIFIFDSNILENLNHKDDPRVTFIWNALNAINDKLSPYGSRLFVFYGNPLKVISKIIELYKIRKVYTNKDYEPYSRSRDSKVKDFLFSKTIEFEAFKDHVIFEEKEILKKDGLPYTVFTPYKRKWLEIKAGGNYSKGFPSEGLFNNFYQTNFLPIPQLKEFGFQKSILIAPELRINLNTIKNYDKNRDFPSIENGTTRLGVHIRFGTISIRKLVKKAEIMNATYLSELIWRDFYSQILANFPRVANKCFKPKYEFIEWDNNEEYFQKWKIGKTGYPLVDAGMRELNKTGYMHNRVRMVVASFLTKHLRIDYRWGEAYFAEKLFDYELASNNGGWQWAAGCGTDAAPYFRIFNPTTQLQKFDKDLKYVKKWIPEFGSTSYPLPIVDHKMAREECLSMYKKALDR